MPEGFELVKRKRIALNVQEKVPQRKSVVARLMLATCSMRSHVRLEDFKSYIGASAAEKVFGGKNDPRPQHHMLFTHAQ